MTAQVHRDNLIRPRCGSNRTPKDGHSRGNQTCRCRKCHYRFIPNGNRHYYPASVKTRAFAMYIEGMGALDIGRTLAVKPGTVYSWLAKSKPGPDGVADAPAAAGVPASAAATSAGNSL